MHTQVVLDFAGQKFRFWLPLPRIFELERLGNGGAGKSVFAMFDEIGAGLGFVDDKPVYLSGGGARAEDIRNIIRLGLIGGNADADDAEVGPNRAAQLVEDYVYPARPLVEGLALAWAILNAAINGIDVKKNELPAQGEESDLSRSTEEPLSPTADISD